MKIRILAVGQKMPAWVEEGVNEYLKRLPPEFKVVFEETPLGQRKAGKDLKKALAKESEALLSKIKDKDKVIALDVKGKSWSSEDLAAQAEDWRMDGRDLVLLIGGPDGLSRDCLARAEQRWSLSALTLPHPLVRVLLAEQLYRAWTLLSGHPYHR
ncbi:23S rRNA (pseudouridine1915-N3)-methyltransferase [Marinospirillum celere]|uniref:Ribosomal RNA large subunit methyltransferase H n=1 Tax=Marinospirillum celere TaxID=1122252 RepID=A0A1I1FVT2_9GAMM|nr:23S rRNA (pseudouridine(1915)-N(3))-methyltransferase RlmH [Marinospirillum celere]SFC03132.1 23S rRNA (pseudouridine1915-N3)-methyltransferase [Marinospirillum celere]